MPYDGGVLEQDTAVGGDAPVSILQCKHEHADVGFEFGGVP